MDSKVRVDLQDVLLAQRELWPRALKAAERLAEAVCAKAMDEALPNGCEHVRRGVNRLR